MDYHSFFPKVEEAAQYLKGKIKIQPKLLIVLTGGSEAFVEAMEDRQEFVSTELPHFPETRVEGHAGKIIFGKYEGVPLVVMQGRYHYYEGHSPQAVVFPYFVFKQLGVQAVLTTNAVGGINSSFRPGDLVVVKDHINMMGTNPLIGIAIQRDKDQFTGLTDAYDEDLRELAYEVAKEQGIDLKIGVYMAATGPSYETKAEIKAYRMLGADTIGMSSVFEVIACKFLKLKVLTINCVANPAADLHVGEMTHEKVLAEVMKAQEKMTMYLGAVVEKLK